VETNRYDDQRKPCHKPKVSHFSLHTESCCRRGSGPEWPASLRPPSACVSRILPTPADLSTSPTAFLPGAPPRVSEGGEKCALRKAPCHPGCSRHTRSIRLSEPRALPCGAPKPCKACALS